MQVEQQQLKRLSDIDWTKVPKKYSVVAVNSDGVVMGHRHGCVPVVTGEEDYRFESPYSSVVLGTCAYIPVNWQDAYVTPSMNEFQTKCYGDPDGAVAL